MRGTTSGPDYAAAALAGTSVPLGRNPPDQWYRPGELACRVASPHSGGQSHNSPRVKRILRPTATACAVSNTEEQPGMRDELNFAFSTALRVSDFGDQALILPFAIGIGLLLALS